MIDLIDNTAILVRTARVSLGSLVVCAGLAAFSLGCAAEALGDEAAAAEEEDTAATADRIVFFNNLAWMKPTSQSSTAYGGASGRAVDGITSGDYAAGSVTHTALQAAPWWQVDLQSVKDIKYVKLYNRTDCCMDRLLGVKVLVSEDASTWHTHELAPALWNLLQFYGLPASFTSISFDVSRPARYVKVQLPGTNILSLAEVKVTPPVVDPDAGWYRIRTEYNDECLDVPDSSTASGKHIINWPCHTDPNQQVKFEPMGDGWYRIKFRHSGKYLTVPSNSNEILWKLVQSGATGDDSQLFRIEDRGDGTFRLWTKNDLALTMHRWTEYQFFRDWWDDFLAQYDGDEENPGWNDYVTSFFSVDLVEPF